MISIKKVVGYGAYIIFMTYATTAIFVGLSEKYEKYKWKKYYERFLREEREKGRPYFEKIE